MSSEQAVEETTVVGKENGLDETGSRGAMNGAISEPNENHVDNEYNHNFEAKIGYGYNPRRAGVQKNPYQRRKLVKKQTDFSLDEAAWPTLDEVPTKPKKLSTSMDNGRKKDINWVAVPSSFKIAPSSRSHKLYSGSGKYEQRRNKRRFNGKRRGGGSGWRGGGNHNQYGSISQSTPGYNPMQDVGVFYPDVYYPPFIPPQEPGTLSTAILEQIEYYLSVENLCKDLYLRKHMDMEGFVPLALLAGFNRLKTITNAVNDISVAAEDSKILELSGDKMSIRRKDDWKDFLPPAQDFQPVAPRPTTKVVPATEATPKLTVADKIAASLEKQNQPKRKKESHKSTLPDRKATTNRKKLLSENVHVDKLSKQIKTDKAVNDKPQKKNQRKKLKKKAEESDAANNKNVSVKPEKIQAPPQKQQVAQSPKTPAEYVGDWQVASSRGRKKEKKNVQHGDAGAAKPSKNSRNSTANNRRKKVKQGKAERGEGGTSDGSSHQGKTHLNAVEYENLTKRLLVLVANKSALGSALQPEETGAINTKFCLYQKEVDPDSDAKATVRFYPATGKTDAHHIGWVLLPNTEGSKVPALKPELAEHGFAQHRFNDFRARCLQEHKKLGSGKSSAMNTLVRFWAHFLPTHYYTKAMYKELHAFALQEFKKNSYPMDCLFRFYPKFLPTNFRLEIFKHFHNAVRMDIQAGRTYGLEQLWIFLGKRTSTKKLIIDANIRHRLAEIGPSLQDSKRNKKVSDISSSKEFPPLLPEAKVVSSPNPPSPEKVATPDAPRPSSNPWSNARSCLLDTSSAAQD